MREMPPRRRKNPLVQAAAVLLGFLLGIALLGRLDSSGLPILVGAAIGVALVLAFDALRRRDRPS